MNYHGMIYLFFVVHRSAAHKIILPYWRVLMIVCLWTGGHHANNVKYTCHGCFYYLILFLPYRWVVPARAAYVVSN